MNSAAPIPGSAASTEERWVTLHLNRLSALLERGWVWSSMVLRRRQHLVLISPRGAVWEFKLHHGAWLRRVGTEKTE